MKKRRNRAGVPGRIAGTVSQKAVPEVSLFVPSTANGGVAKTDWQQKRRGTPSEENKSIARRMTDDVWNKGDLDAVDELCAPELVLHSAPAGMPSGTEGVKAIVGVYRGAFQNFKATNDFVIAEGDKVASRWTTRATHRGELMGIPAAGKQITTTGISLSRIANGKIVEVWSESDQMDLMRQLGVVPT